MPKNQMIINYVPGEECRVALVEGNKLEELHVERFSSVSRVGNIYVGRVNNVEAAIQAAFVDFGVGENGFLHVSDLHPRYFPGEDVDETTERVGRKTPRRDRPPIQHALRRGQEVLVQVLKEGVGTKGPTLTSYLSIPGRFLVMMPNMDKVGVSRKVEDEELRRKMREILDQLDLPEGFGFILRTAGMDRTKVELKRDLAYLQRLWKDMERRLKVGSKPRLLFSESDLLVRSLRDLLSTDISEVIIDDEKALKRAARFMKIVAPRGQAKLLHFPGKMPIFHAFGIEQQITMIHAREVPLPSGGRLVIDQTEALVAIDVNSGKSRDARDAERNAFTTNLEAVDEICRQLRLRDLGGIIVNDLIDMRDSKHRREVETRFKDRLKRDRARTTTAPISAFGILEMTRQRMRGSHESLHFLDCPTCRGRGLVQKPDSVATDALRDLAALLDLENVAKVELVVAPRVAGELLSTKRQLLGRIERRSGKHVDVRVSEAVPVDRVTFYAYDGVGNDIDLNNLPKLRPPSTLVEWEPEPAPRDDSDAGWAVDVEAERAEATAVEDDEPAEDDEPGDTHPIEIDETAEDLDANRGGRGSDRGAGAGEEGEGGRRRRRRRRRGRGGRESEGDNGTQGAFDRGEVAATGDRPRDDRARDARPGDDQPHQDRAREDRARDDRGRDDRRRDDRGRDDRARDDRGRDGRGRDARPLAEPSRGDREGSREGAGAHRGDVMREPLRPPMGDVDGAPAPLESEPVVLTGEDAEWGEPPLPQFRQRSSGAPGGEGGSGMPRGPQRDSRGSEARGPREEPREIGRGDAGRPESGRFEAGRPQGFRPDAGQARRDDRSQPRRDDRSFDDRREPRRDDRREGRRDDRPRDDRPQRRDDRRDDRGGFGQRRDGGRRDARPAYNDDAEWGEPPLPQFREGGSREHFDGDTDADLPPPREPVNAGEPGAAGAPSREPRNDRNDRNERNGQDLAADRGEAAGTGGDDDGEPRRRRRRRRRRGRGGRGGGGEPGAPVEAGGEGRGGDEPPFDGPRDENDDRGDDDRGLSEGGELDPRDDADLEAAPAGRSLQEDDRGDDRARRGQVASDHDEPERPALFASGIDEGRDDDVDLPSPDGDGTPAEASDEPLGATQGESLADESGDGEPKRKRRRRGGRGRGKKAAGGEASDSTDVVGEALEREAPAPLENAPRDMAAKEARATKQSASSPEAGEPDAGEPKRPRAKKPGTRPTRGDAVSKPSKAASDAIAEPKPIGAKAAKASTKAAPSRTSKGSPAKPAAKSSEAASAPEKGASDKGTSEKGPSDKGASSKGGTGKVGGKASEPKSGSSGASQSPAKAGPRSLYGSRRKLTPAELRRKPKPE
ncbi:MAG: Rne/Rng family ribonuclease [Planctomycetota bacterium]|nr:Rne/Rng family ribonuclease [Planctomycetota bacterium]